MHQSREENQRLKEELEKQEIEKVKNETNIGQVEDYILQRKVKDPMKKESNKVIGFKTQLQDIRNEIKEKEKRLQCLKRDQKIQIMIEKETEEKAFRDVIESMNIGTQGRMTDDVKRMRNENMHIMKQIKSIDDQNQELQQ